MFGYARIPIWENRRRVALLRDVRTRLITYYESIEPVGFAGAFEAKHNETADQVREWLNHHLLDLHRVLAEAGVGTVASYTPPPAVGGPTQVVDVIHNLFRAQAIQMTPRMIVDLVDQARGVYEADAGRARVRTFNPFFWIGFAIERLAALPFAIVGAAGFDRGRAESSLLGRLVKSVGLAVGWLAAFLAVLQFLDVLEPAKAFVRGLFRPN